MILLCWLPLFVVRVLVVAMQLASKTLCQALNHEHEREQPAPIRISALMMSHRLRTSATKHRESETNQVPMDADSYEMRIDTGASHCISHDKRDFVGKLIPTRGSIQGYHEVDCPGRLFLGTMKFSLTDDEGEQHSFEVPNSIYDTQGQHKLLCPQHWSRECKGIEQAYEKTNNETTTLVWKTRLRKKWHQKTVQHRHSRAPVPVLHTSSGYIRYNAYCAQIKPPDDFCCYSLHLHQHDDGEDCSKRPSVYDHNDGEHPPQAPSERCPDGPGTCEPCNGTDAPSNITLDAQLRPSPLPLEFQAIQVSDDTPHIVEDEEVTFRDDQQELLHWHHRLGHMPFTRLKEAAEVGIIPRRLRNVKPPKCTACLYAKATKKPWRTKAPPTDMEVPTVNAPGAVVSVD